MSQDRRTSSRKVRPVRKRGKDDDRGKQIMCAICYRSLTDEMPTPALNKWHNDADRLSEIPETKEVLEQFPPRDFNLHAGHFLIDREGIVRRAWVETRADDLSRWGMFPSDNEILAAVRASNL